MSHQYGPVFTVYFPKPTVFITKLSLIKEALINQGDIYSGRTQNPVANPTQLFENGGIMFSELEPWREQRRFAVHTLRDFGMSRKVMEDKIGDSVATLIGQIDDLLQKGPLDMNWPIQLCVINVINELLFGYHFPVDDCDKYLRFCDHLNKFAKLFGNRKTVLLCQAYPWMRHLPIIGYYGFGEIRERLQKVVDFISEEVELTKKSIDYNAEPDTFVAAYRREIKRLEKIGKKDSSSSFSCLSTKIGHNIRSDDVRSSA